MTQEKLKEFRLKWLISLKFGLCIHGFGIIIFSEFPNASKFTKKRVSKLCLERLRASHIRQAVMPGMGSAGNVSARFRSERAMTTRCISVVPSTTFITGAMRYIRSSEYGANRP